MDAIARRFIVHGRVQGVGFRYFTVGVAEELPVSGQVRNLPSGEVEVIVEGDPASVERLLSRLRQGPSMSRVDRVDEHELSPSGRYRGFRVAF